MKGIEEKRASFREEIRRRYINNMFREVREKLMQQQSTSFPPMDHSLSEHYGNMLRQILARVIPLQKTGNYKAITDQLQILVSAVHEQPQSLSYCLNQQLLERGQYLIDSVRKDVPESVLGDLSDEEDNQMEQSQASDKVGYDELMMVLAILKLAEKLYLQKFAEESMILVLKMLWNVPSNNYHLNLTNNPGLHLQIMQAWLNCLTKLLNSPHQKLMRKHMKELGIASVLNALIDASNKFSTDSHLCLLSLINSYVRPDDHDTDDLVGGIVVLGNDIQSKIRYVVYCVYLIRQNQPSLVIPCLCILDQMLSQYGYLVEHLDVKQFQPILQLVLHPDRQLSVCALDVINTVAFFSDNICDEMMQLPNSILDVVSNRLIFESTLQIQEPNTRRSVDKCTNVLCDLLLTNTPKIKKILFEHPIWQFIYHNINENSPLFSTVIVFKYFFPCFGRTKSLKVLPSVLDAFATLPLHNNQSDQIKQVKQIMRLVMDEAGEFWPEDDYDIVVAMMEDRGLMKFVEEEEIS